MTRPEDSRGPIAKTVGIFSRQLERRTGPSPHYKAGAVLCTLPLSQKFELFAWQSVSPAAILIAGANAGIDQAWNTDPSYGQGAAGYGKRFGATMADQASGLFFKIVVYPTIFSEDPRYYRLGQGPGGKRLFHALEHSVVARHENGKRTFNYSEWLGTASAVALSNVYRPDNARGFGPAAARVGIGVAWDTGFDVLREFWPEVARKFHLPHRGQPPQAAQDPNRLSSEDNVPGSSPSASQKFAELSDRFMKDALALSPVAATSAGYHTHKDPETGKTVELDALLDDMSLDAIKKQRAFYVAWQQRFLTETPPETLDPQDAADWRLISDQIALNLLEFDHIQSYRHHPTAPVELVGNAIFLPLTQSYAPKDVRLGHVLSRIAQVPRLLAQVERYLSDADPVFIQTAVEENDGNIDLIEHTVAGEIAPGSPLRAEYDRVAPPAIAALKNFSRWLQDDLAKRQSRLDWRLGKDLYAEKFKLVMETNVTPEDVLAAAERDLQAVRAEMLALAFPMHSSLYSAHGDHSDLAPQERENSIIGEVLQKISDDHPRRDRLQAAVEADLDSISQFIREKKIVSLSSRGNLKVVPTPPFMRGIYSVAGFMSAPPLEPQAQAQYWVTPIDPKTPEDKAESRLREYNSYVLKWLTIHEALPGHYIQFEHLNSIQPQRRRLVRALFANGAYVEGWAEYIAQVMMDEGFLGSDPRFRLAMRKIRLRLLANAILDVRMHTMGMSDEQAMDLMLNDTFQTQAEAEGKLRRAKLSSTQLPTYYVGLREWLAFREKYQAAAGKNFDLLKFHDAALDLGPLPVPLVEKLMLPPKG